MNFLTNLLSFGGSGQEDQDTEYYNNNEEWEDEYEKIYKLASKSEENNLSNIEVNNNKHIRKKKQNNPPTVTQNVEYYKEINIGTAVYFTDGKIFRPNEDNPPNGIVVNCTNSNNKRYIISILFFGIANLLEGKPNKSWILIENNKYFVK